MASYPEARREQFLERPLPSSEESERAILGAILLDNSLISQSVEQLQVEDFYSPLHRRIFNAMISLFESSKSIDPILIGEELKKEGGSIESHRSAVTARDSADASIGARRVSAWPHFLSSDA